LRIPAINKDKVISAITRRDAVIFPSSFLRAAIVARHGIYRVTKREKINICLGFKIIEKLVVPLSVDKRINVNSFLNKPKMRTIPVIGGNPSQ